MLNELFENDSLIGTDRWIATKSGDIWILGTGGRKGTEPVPVWYSFCGDLELTIYCIEDMENFFGLDNLISACAEYEEYVENGDIFARFNAIVIHTTIVEHAPMGGGRSFVDMVRILSNSGAANA